MLLWSPHINWKYKVHYQTENLCLDEGDTLLAGFAGYKKHVSFGLAFALQSEDREVLEEKPGKNPYKSSSTKKCRPQL